jgi:sterol desaturase/sphingolipid hydroxylase (fatty acid hydroxylase superfamily)
MLRPMRRASWTSALRTLAYPLVTGGSVVFCLWALGQGWSPSAIGVAVVAASVVAVDLLERLIPYSAAWATPRGDWPTDFWHFAISSRGFDVGSFAALSLFTPLGQWLSARWGIHLWPTGLPVWAQAVLALMLVELPWYWMHRWEHEWAWFWRIHSVHHSAQRMYWWNLSRNHPLDNLFSAAVSVAVLSLVGVPDAPLALVTAFSAAHGMLQHANADLRTGVFDVFFTTARVHRWHHSPRLKESQANYGPTLTLWDFVFRTRHFEPERVPGEDVGLGPGLAHFPADFRGQLSAPFDDALWQSAPSDATPGGAPVRRSA